MIKADRNTIIDALRAKANEILPKGSRVVLYGSRARGDYHEDSDWDIHILVPGPEKIRFDAYDEWAWPLADVGLSFGEIVNPRLYSYLGWAKRSFLPFYANVERDKQLIFQN